VRYITKGDANEDPDPREVQESDIVGKVLLSIPLAGYAVNFAQKPIGFALIIIVPASVIIIDEIKKIYLELKKKKNG
jgi:signal peptidase